MTIFFDFRCYDRTGIPHAAGVRSLVIVASCEVLGAYHWCNGLASCECHATKLLGLQAFFYDHSLSSFSKSLVLHDHLEGVKGFLHSGGNKNALACSKAVQLLSR